MLLFLRQSRHTERIATISSATLTQRLHTERMLHFSGKADTQKECCYFFCNAYTQNVAISSATLTQRTGKYAAADTVTIKYSCVFRTADTRNTPALLATQAHRLGKQQAVDTVCSSLFGHADTEGREVPRHSHKVLLSLWQHRQTQAHLNGFLSLVFHFSMAQYHSPETRSLPQQDDTISNQSD